jgi:hypothetical protein
MWGVFPPHIGVIPHDRQSPGVGIQATARYIHVHGNPTIRYHV